MSTIITRWYKRALLSDTLWVVSAREQPFLICLHSKDRFVKLYFLDGGETKQMFNGKRFNAYAVFILSRGYEEIPEAEALALLL